MPVAKKPRVALGVTALAGLTALGGVGAVMSHDTTTLNGAGPARINITEVATTSTKPGTTTSATDTGSSSSTPSSPSNGAGMSQLMSLLPGGYSSSNCGPADMAVPDSLATVDCGQNSNSNGPSSARFALFADQPTLDRKFADFIGEDQLTPCPGGLPSPGPWSYTGSTTESDGQIACGSYQGAPELIWTQNAELMLGGIQGSDIGSLYKYWTNPSASSQMAPQRG